MLSLPRDITLHDNVETLVTVVAAEIIGEPVVSVSRLNQGGNNVTLLVKTARSGYVAKHYPNMPEDGRDRLLAETVGLGFLNAAGFSAVPILVGSDPVARVVVMSECGAPASRAVMKDDIEACVAFIQGLHGARKFVGAETIPPAAEASPAPNDVVNQIVARRRRFEEVSAGYPELGQFLHDAFDPALNAYRRESDAALAVAGIGAKDRLPRRWQTLSPSDFGFHNAVRGGDGRLTFIDFEYFGWDDPVRMVSDFLLHPGHHLDGDAKRQFMDGCRAVFGSDPYFSDRFGALYYLIGLRWCMILLNEFLPERMARRQAAGNAHQLARVLTRQLRKADMLLTSLKNNKGNFID